MDINVGVRAIEKLVDYTASGIGSTASFFFSRMVARRDAEVRLITAEGEVEAQRILSEGQATSMQIIATAQTEARSKVISPEAALQGEVAIGELISQRVQFQEEKRQANLGSVVAHAAQELGDREVRDHEVDHDWTARFFNDVQDVSSEEMQQLWAKVLAGEVERPGSTSIKTLGILKNLDKSTADLFRKFGSICVSMRLDGINFNDARVPFLGDYSEGNALRDYGFEFGKLNVLSEHGLIYPEYNTWHDYSSSTGLNLPQTQTLVHIPFCYQGKYWILVPTNAGAQGIELKLSGVALTSSGQEISKIVDLLPNQQYTQHLVEHFKKNSLQMVEVPTWEPRITDTSL